MACLEQLLEGCQDLGERLLGFLAPRELALLACACRALRTVVARLPEGLWQVREQVAAPTIHLSAC